MSSKSTGSFTQYGRNYQAQLTTANTNYTSPTNTAILWQAAPDGSDLWGVSAVQNANQGSANQVQLFLTPDGGTTFNFLPLTAALGSGNITQTGAATLVNFNHTNGIPLGPTNPFILGGRGGGFTNVMTNSVLTDSALYFRCLAPTAGTANALAQALCFNSAGTQLAASPSTGTIVDFEAGLTCSAGATTAAFGLQSAQTIKRAVQVLANPSAGDITAQFKYRAVWDGTQWQLLITDRLLVAIGQTQGVTVTAWGADR